MGGTVNLASLSLLIADISLFFFLKVVKTPSTMTTSAAEKPANVKKVYITFYMSYFKCTKLQLHCKCVDKSQLK